jgi:serine/threonine protein kinase
LQHSNIIQIKEVLLPEKDDFEDIYIVYELMETDLSAIIKSQQELSPDHVQYFLYQLLRGLKFIHSANIIHRDLVIIFLFIRKIYYIIRNQKICWSIQIVS